ncbi:nuclear transport factor 2 family protein [Alloacidobacterium dinghuense]|uniref:Nuclear transport factor 2 family protein n=1 Tax=Alloacidobacterium dinghuense TaxID=2763107 RepID=A0A7G8BM73_9BACT|nr:nuclear transport factor 2 family protein [Alloacidobacterium dinghuense]QNI33643.1 nuclear transport factor 2 family protein [Alloacidobacterium dinghuense]
MSVSQTVQSAMQQTNDLFCSAVVKNRQIDVLDNIYTANARILPPGTDLIEGRAQIKNFWEQAIAALAVTDATLATVDAETAGDSVIEIGRADLTLEGGQKVAVKYVVHWKQEDGRWKWNTDIWNMNQ